MFLSTLFSFPSYANGLHMMSAFPEAWFSFLKKGCFLPTFYRGVVCLSGFRSNIAGSLPFMYDIKHFELHFEQIELTIHN